MALLTEALRIFIEAADRPIRTLMPGRVGNVTRSEAGERDADFNPGIADLVAGEADPGTPSPDSPVMVMAGGGFFVGLPVQSGDEAVAIASDRALDEWRDSRTVGRAPTFERFKDDSDAMVFPFAITAPDGAPATWDGLILGGPSGVAVEVAADGPVTITKQGAPVATISLEASGSVTIEVLAGQSVNIGGPAATELAKWAQLETAIGALLAAGSGAGTGAPGTTGKLAFDAATIAWNAAKGAIPTTKAKGE